jgi:hypothetical protein
MRIATEGTRSRRTREPELWRRIISASRARSAACSTSQSTSSKVPVELVGVDDPLQAAGVLDGELELDRAATVAVVDDDVGPAALAAAVV